MFVEHASEFAIESHNRLGNYINMYNARMCSCMSVQNLTVLVVSGKKPKFFRTKKSRTITFT